MSVADPTAAPAFSDLLPWPPPGLARIQGDLWLVVHKMGLAALILVAPLLAVLCLPQDPTNLGPLGEAWWVVLVTSLFGTALFADALVTFIRLLARARRAVRDGYDLRTVVTAAADRDRDMGFLLQGAHAFSALGDRERALLVRLRILGQASHLMAVCWVAFAFGPLLVLSARGGLSPTGLALATLAPATLAGLAGMIFRAVDGSLSGRARRSWHGQSWTADLARQDVAAWRTEATEREVVPEPPRMGVRGLRVISVVAVAAAGVALLPGLTVVPASSMGPIVASLTSMRFTATTRRVAEAEVLRDYRLPTDPAVGPQEAGQLLNTLSHVGRDGAREGFRDPSVVYPDSWFPSENPAGIGQFPAYLADPIWEDLARGFAPETEAYLRAAASHPAHELFARLAGAEGIDIVAARYEAPFNHEWSFHELPIPRYSTLREGAYAQVALAAVLANDGRLGEAEAVARQLISVGLLMIDHEPFLIGTLIGSVLARSGQRALQGVLEIAGRGDEAEALATTLDVSERVVERITAVVGEWTPQDFVRHARSVALDENAPRGLRWEMMGQVALITPCLNPRTIVFGPGTEHSEWSATAAASLVRYESEQELFDMVSRGLSSSSADRGVLERFLSLGMASSERIGSCADLVASVRRVM